MSADNNIDNVDEKTSARYERLNKDAEEAGYHLNPDKSITLDLVEGLIVNEERFGYQSCPCRLADGEKLEDLDIICPCDYRDPDLNDYGSCYCGLYVSDEVVTGQDKIKVVPERRPARENRAQIKAQLSKQAEGTGGTSGEGIVGGPSGVGETQENEAATRAKTELEPGPAYPVWRCRVCGYLCAREEPPGVCPICKAKKDRFERFVF